VRGEGMNVLIWNIKGAFVGMVDVFRNQ